jgi:Right handed beta helix region
MVTAPCRTFAFALTQTAAGGEIDVLDPGGYGTVTITKAVSIVNDGVGVAAIGAPSSLIGVTIKAGANDSVHLRGLTIDGLGSGQFGILFITGRNLAIENCVIRNFAIHGIEIAPSTSSSFSVLNTIASNNKSHGIDIGPTATVKGVLNKVTTNNNNVAIWVDGRGTTGALNVTIVDSEASDNAAAGVCAISAWFSKPTVALM